MALRWYTTVIDCRDHSAQAQWWAEVLDWRLIVDEEEGAVVIPPWLEAEPMTVQEWDRGNPGLVFVPVPEDKAVKNRLHLDLAAHVDDDRDAEIARLERMGARRVDVRQSGDEAWTVLADPEDNEFCVLESRRY
ncbi:VOC family protein [Nocardiopsis sp. HNM0947]|uniref:VOC family protein n=1 Tax=Nocardiopsis coralli TaxID=2772213 RepID=A0ABR9P176_9ACTN|nr:VOC family protein [Nocardiopsis coralli]MBE2997570.1 VOC family protein [Nocardiopsis coralli]